MDAQQDMDEQQRDKYGASIYGCILANDLLRKNRFDEAIEMLNKAIVLSEFANPHLPILYKNLSLAYNAKEDYEQALHCIDMAIDFESNEETLGEFNALKTKYKELKQAKGWFNIDLFTQNVPVRTNFWHLDF